MNIIEVSEDEYKEIIHPQLFYNTPEFNHLNKKKADAVHYLLFKDSKSRFGLTIGEKEDGWYCPFSAPFGSFVNAKSKWDIIQLCESIYEFDKYMAEKRQMVQFQLPPEFYAPKMVCVMQNSLFHMGYRARYIDINYQLDFMSSIPVKTDILK